MSHVEVDFGAGPAQLASSSLWLDLMGEHLLVRVPADGPIRWAELEKLPHLRTVTRAGPERGILDAIAGRPNIRFLYWADATGDVDLTSTSLVEFGVDGDELRSIRLPRSIEKLQLGRPRANFNSAAPPSTMRKTLQVEAPNAGRGLRLVLWQFESDVVIPDGLRGTSDLTLWVGGEVSATVLSNMTGLEKLTLTFDRPPGTISHLADLRRHTALQSLQLDDAYGLTMQDLPELPALRWLELHGIRRTTAAAAKARYRGSAVKVSTTGTKTDEWLALHMDNPFRDWIEDSKPFGRAACAAYDRARRAGQAIPASDPGRLAAAERVLRGLVADLNAIDRKFGLIDTPRREESGAAFLGLAEDLGVRTDQADAWFDEDRTF